jgi:hypothetical protein
MRIEENIRCMTREEKIAECKSYVGHTNVDMDRIMAIYAEVGGPDSALDDALARCAQAVGAALGREPLTASEFAEAMQKLRRR